MNVQRSAVRAGMVLALWVLAGSASAQCGASNECIEVNLSARESVATFPGGMER